MENNLKLVLNYLYSDIDSHNIQFFLQYMALAFHYYWSNPPKNLFVHNFFYHNFQH
jgi:hypothetical protein